MSQCVGPVVDAGGHSQGVKAKGHAEVTDSQVDDEKLGWFEKFLLLIGHIEQHGVPYQ